MEIKYKIIKDSKLLIKQFYGDWSNKDYETFLKFITNTDDWKSVDKTISDLRNANVENAFDEISSGAEMVKKYLTNSPKNVFLVDQPMATAIVHLYKQESESISSQTHKYCSSVDCLIEILDLKISKVEMKMHIDNLELFSNN